MPSERDDPTAIRAIVVTAEDVVAALEARRRTGRRAVLRVTPPFAARMRARLHVAGRGSDDGDSRPVNLHPERLVERVPQYPEPGATGEPPSDPADDRERAASVATWRTAVGERIVDEVRLPGTDNRVTVTALGADGGPERPAG
ncbi:MAG: hypothetical protein ABEH78_09590 [Haloferacaceae archaeon]